MNNSVDNEQKIIDRIRKLMALANNNNNEHEATAALARAQALMEEYNIEEHSIGETAKGGQRSDKSKKGGLYKWQRDIWQSVAEANFCLYYSVKGLKKGQAYQNRVIGSNANTVTTELMADYLQATIERLTKEYAKVAFPGYSVFIRELIAYREGLATRICERLKALQRQREQEAEKKAKEEAARARHPSAAPSSRNSLTVVEVRTTEHDLNLDHVLRKEPGYHAALRARCEAAAAQYQADRELEKKAQEEWERNNPEEAEAKKKAAQEKADREWEEYQKREERNAKRRKGVGYRYRNKTAEEQRRDLDTFSEGYDKGDEVSLHSQTEQEKRSALK